MNYLINIKKTGLLKMMGKTLSFSLVIMACLLFQSCETEKPECDSTPPNFSFRITGDGFDHTFTQANHFEDFRLNLKIGATYNFVYTGYDAGGMQDMQLVVPYIHVEAPISSPWSVSSWRDFNTFSWHGDAAHRVTGSLLTGTFTVSAAPAPFAIRFSLSDFGGRSCPPNSIAKELEIVTGNHNTEIVSR
jgi:hypothetical protein